MKNERQIMLLKILGFQDEEISKSLELDIEEIKEIKIVEGEELKLVLYDTLKQISVMLLIEKKRHEFRRDNKFILELLKYRKELAEKLDSILKSEKKTKGQKKLVA